jgi:hypothetical protein
MARHAIVGSFTVLLTVVVLGQARAQQFVCCRQFCGNGIVNCELPPASACAVDCSNLCGGFGAPCIGATPSACPDGQNPSDCAEGCQAICPPTFTPTVTPTNTPVPIGGGCSMASQCAAPGFCVDNVCCDTACTEPLEKCNLSGQGGTCVSAAAPAPALTRWGLLVAAILLVSVAAFALRHRMRSR